MLFTSEKTKERFLLDYDQYGDSYMEDADEANLQGIFSEINGKVFRLLVFVSNDINCNLIGLIH